METLDHDSLPNSSRGQSASKSLSQRNAPLNFQDNAISDEMSLKDLILIIREWWKYILSKWFIILLVSSLGGIVGIIYAYSKKPVYTAELTFVLEDEKSGGMSGALGLASQFGINMGASGGQGVFVGESFLALMKSRLMVEKALMTTFDVNGKKETLVEFYINFNKLRQQWAKNGSQFKNVKFLSEVNPSEFTVEQNALMRNFYNTLISNNLLIEKPDKKSSIISLKVVSENELFSKYFVEALAKEAANFYVETKTKKSAHNLRVLQYQTDSIRRELDLSLVGVAASADANPNPNLGRQTLRVPSQRKQGDVQINQVILAQLVQNLEIAKMALRTETPLIQVIDRPVLPLMSTSTSKLLLFIKWSLICGFITSIFLMINKFLNSL